MNLNLFFNKILSIRSFKKIRSIPEMTVERGISRPAGNSTAADSIEINSSSTGPVPEVGANKSFDDALISVPS